jgi:hypothetical protein
LQREFYGEIAGRWIRDIHGLLPGGRKMAYCITHSIAKAIYLDLAFCD